MKTTSQVSQTSQAKPKGTNRFNRSDDLLAGRCFMEIAEDGAIETSGLIWGRVEPGYYLIQYFEAFMGEPSMLKVVDLQTIMRWRLEEDDEALRFACEYGFAGAAHERAMKKRTKKLDEK